MGKGADGGRGGGGASSGGGGGGGPNGNDKGSGGGGASSGGGGASSGGGGGGGPNGNDKGSGGFGGGLGGPVSGIGGGPNSSGVGPLSGGSGARSTGGGVANARAGSLSGGTGAGSIGGGLANATPSTGFGHTYDVGIKNALIDAKPTGNTIQDFFERDLPNLLGFNESVNKASILGQLKDGVPAGQVRADWGYDPAGFIGSLAGAAVPGLGLVTGYLADQLSAAAGRPLGINFGPDVFGGSSFSKATPVGSRYGGVSDFVDRANGRQNPVENVREPEPRWWQQGPVTPSPETPTEEVTAPRIIGAGPLSTLTPIRLNRFRDPSFNRLPPALFR